MSSADSVRNPLLRCPPLEPPGPLILLEAHVSAGGGEGDFSMVVPAYSHRERICL